MENEFTYSGRDFTAKDIEHIKKVIAQNPGKSRHFLSQELCRQWDWRQQNGVLRDMVCRGLMLKLHRDGLISRNRSNDVNKRGLISGNRSIRVQISGA